MKRIILCGLFWITMSFAGMSQTATEGKLEFQKGEKQVAIIELPYPPEIVEGALRETLVKRGAKEERSKGMLVFKGARFAPTDGEVADLYFKIDKKGRKDDNTSVVYLITGRPNENVALRTGDDGFRIADGKAFLNNLMPALEAYNLEVNILKQEDEIKKTEKKLKVLQDDYKDIERRIGTLQERLDQNKKEQDAMNAEVVRQRTVRDTLHAKRIVSTN